MRAGVLPVVAVAALPCSFACSRCEAQILQNTQLSPSPFSCTLFSLQLPFQLLIALHFHHTTPFRHRLGPANTITGSLRSPASSSPYQAPLAGSLSPITCKIRLVVVVAVVVLRRPAQLTLRCPQVPLLHPTWPLSQVHLEPHFNRFFHHASPTLQISPFAPRILLSLA